MAKYTPKAARERSERFETVWQENSPAQSWSEMSLADFKAKKKAANDVEDELAANDARGKALQIKRDGLYEELMTDCDFIAADVESDRSFGKDSALYGGGFGYIRESEKKRGGGRKKTTA